MGLLDMQISEFVCQIIFLRYFGIKSLYENLVIYSYKTILYCTFDNQIIRFVVDPFIGSTFYAEQFIRFLRAARKRNSCDY